MDNSVPVAVLDLACPSCGSRELHSVWSGALNNYLCHRCGTCWRASVAGLGNVDPLSCQGCSYHRICRGALAERTRRRG